MAVGSSVYSAPHGAPLYFEYFSSLLPSVLLAQRAQPAAGQNADGTPTGNPPQYVVAAAECPYLPLMWLMCNHAKLIRYAIVGSLLVRELAPPREAQCPEVHEAARDDVSLTEGVSVKARDEDGDDAHTHPTALHAAR